MEPMLSNFYINKWSRISEVVCWCYQTVQHGKIKKRLWGFQKESLQTVKMDFEMANVAQCKQCEMMHVDIDNSKFICILMGSKVSERDPESW